MGKIVYDNLTPLFQAGSEEQVHRICQLAYNSFSTDDQSVAITATTLDTNEEKATLVLHTLRLIVQASGSATDPTKILSQFPETFPQEVATPIAKAIAERNSSNHSAQQLGTSCMPQLVDFDWRVDTKASSDHNIGLSRASEPTCLLQLRICHLVKQSAQNRGDVDNVDIELTKWTMDSMLDGLGKIRDQLSSIAK